MNTIAWIAVGAFVAAIVARIAEDESSNINWRVASTYFSLGKELAMWALVVRILA